MHLGRLKIPAFQAICSMSVEQPALVYRTFLLIRYIETNTLSYPIRVVTSCPSPLTWHHRPPSCVDDRECCIHTTRTPQNNGWRPSGHVDLGPCKAIICKPHIEAMTCHVS